MDSRKPLAYRNVNWDDMAPFAAARAKIAIAECNEHGYPVAMFEGQRSNQRQDALYAIGRTEPGKKVTNAKAGDSWHQYGLAIDIAYFDGKKWYWPKEEEAWEKPAAIFENHGFEWLFPYERVHFQITCGVRIYEAKTYVKNLQELWDLVESRLDRQTSFQH